MRSTRTIAAGGYLPQPPVPSRMWLNVRRSNGLLMIWLLPPFSLMHTHFSRPIRADTAEEAVKETERPQPVLLLRCRYQPPLLLNGIVTGRLGADIDFPTGEETTRSIRIPMCEVVGILLLPHGAVRGQEVLLRVFPSRFFSRGREIGKSCRFLDRFPNGFPGLTDVIQRGVAVSLGPLPRSIRQ